MKHEDPIESVWRVFLTTMIAAAAVLGMAMVSCAFFEVLQLHLVKAVGYGSVAGIMGWVLCWLIHNRNELVTAS